MTKLAGLLTIVAVLAAGMVASPALSIAYAQSATRTQTKATKPTLEIRKDKKGQYRFFYGSPQ
jgi:hypothetical protein